MIQTVNHAFFPNISVGSHTSRMYLAVNRPTNANPVHAIAISIPESSEVKTKENTINAMHTQRKNATNRLESKLFSRQFCMKHKMCFRKLMV